MGLTRSEWLLDHALVGMAMAEEKAATIVKQQENSDPDTADGTDKAVEEPQGRRHILYRAEKRSNRKSVQVLGVPQLVIV